MTDIEKNKVWNLNSSIEQVNNNNDFFIVNNGGYGQVGCVIFRPYELENYYSGQKFHIEVTEDGKTIADYNVHFFESGVTGIDGPENLNGTYKIIMESDKYEYDGKVITPRFKVARNDGKELKCGDDYTYTCSENPINIGCYHIEVEGINGYTGNLLADFYIRGNLADADVSFLEDEHIYNGEPVKPEFLMTHKGYEGGTGHIWKDWYSAVYKDNDKAGTATVEIEPTEEGMQYFYGKKTVSFNISKQNDGVSDDKIDDPNEDKDDKENKDDNPKPDTPSDQNNIDTPSDNGSNPNSNLTEYEKIKKDITVKDSIV